MKKCSRGLVSLLQWRRVLNAEVVRAACCPSPLEMCAQCGSTISATRSW